MEKASVQSGKLSVSMTGKRVNMRREKMRFASHLNNSTAIDVLVGTSPFKRKGRLPVHVDGNSFKKLYDGGKSMISKRHIRDLKNSSIAKNQFCFLDDQLDVVFCFGFLFVCWNFLFKGVVGPYS